VGHLWGTYGLSMAGLLKYESFHLASFYRDWVTYRNTTMSAEVGGTSVFIGSLSAPVFENCVCLSAAMRGRPNWAESARRWAKQRGGHSGLGADRPRSPHM